MATKTITITEDAYEALAREKKKDESFSELALRLTSKKGELKDCVGLWKLTDKEKEVFEHIRRSWTESDKEFKKKAGQS